MRKVWWIGIGVLALTVAWGCGGGRLIPQDIEKLLQSEGGQWVLKASEGHGGIWRWRSRSYLIFDYAELTVARGMDTVVTNRRRDTTITPRLDTLVNLREHFTMDLDSGFIHARSASQSPLINKGYHGASVWVVRDTVPSADTAELMAATAHLETAAFGIQLPFTLLDTTLQFALAGEVPTVDTVIQKGKDPGTFDTTLTPFTLKKLRVEFPSGRAPYAWAVFYLDARDGSVRRMLTPSDGSDSTVVAHITLWRDIEDVLGIRVGGRRLTFPADLDGNPTGPFVTDLRYYAIDFPRQLETVPFTWVAPEPGAVDSLADSAAASGT